MERKAICRGVEEGGGWTSPMVTLQPREERRRAVERPIPLEPPVMRQVREEKEGRQLAGMTRGGDTVEGNW